MDAKGYSEQLYELAHTADTIARDIRRDAATAFRNNGSVDFDFPNHDVRQAFAAAKEACTAASNASDALRFALHLATLNRDGLPKRNPAAIIHTLPDAAA